MRLADFALLAAALQPVLVLAGPPDESGSLPPGTQSYSYIPGQPESDNADSGRDALTFELYDAYFNGTATFTFAPQSPTDSSCNKTYTNVPALLAVGGITTPSNSSLSRSDWDANNYYFSLKSVVSYADKNCNKLSSAPCTDSFGFESSSEELYFSQGWTVSSQKTGDGYDISGNLTTTKINGDNNYNFYLPACTSYPQGLTIQAEQSFSVQPLFKAADVSMTGHVSATAATMTLIVAKVYNGTQFMGGALTVQFTGTWYNHGASLVTSGPYPAASGIANPVIVPSTSGKLEKYIKIIVPAVVGAAILGLILCCCLKFRKGRRARQRPVSNFQGYGNQGYPTQQQQQYQQQQHQQHQHQGGFAQSYQP